MTNSILSRSCRSVVLLLAVLVVMSSTALAGPAPPPPPPPRSYAPPAAYPPPPYPPPVVVQPAPPPLSPAMRVIYAPFYAAGLVLRYAFYYGIVAPFEVFGRALTYGVEGGVDHEERQE